MADPLSNAQRLESLWSGSFGDEYTRRNADAGARRGPFWRDLLRRVPVRSVLEVGCNIGSNLQWIAPGGTGPAVFGLDVCPGALLQLRSRLAWARAILGTARALPFRTESFDLVFTAGVLIHVPPCSLPTVVDEIVRCARRYVLLLEYWAPQPVTVPYRGQKGALFKSDFGAFCQGRFPRWREAARGTLRRDEGWDDVTWWLFEKDGPKTEGTGR